MSDNDREAGALLTGERVLLHGKVLIPGRRNANGYAYTKEAIDGAYAELKKRMEEAPRTMGVTTSPGSESLADWAGIVVDADQQGDGTMVVGVELLDTPNGKALKTKLMARADGPYRGGARTGLGVAFSGYGSPDEDGVIREVKLHGFSIVPADQLVDPHCTLEPIDD